MKIAPAVINGARNGTLRSDARVDLVALQDESNGAVSLARRLVEKPSDLASFLVELRHLGVDLVDHDHPRRALLDRRAPSPLPNQRKKTKIWTVLSEDQAFAAQVVPLFARKGDLLFVHVGARPDMAPGVILATFKSFVEANAVASVVILDWGGEFGHEHVHALVLVRDRKAFESALGRWATSERIGAKARRWKHVTGWGPFIEKGSRALLERHVARCLAYAEAPPEDGDVRDLHQHAVASGLFEKPWQRFVRDATRSRARSVTPRCCESCQKPLPLGATKRRLFCEGSACRVRHHRRGKQEARKPWRLKKLPKSYVRRLRVFLGGRPGRAGGSSEGRKSLGTSTPRASAKATRKATVRLALPLSTD